MERLWNFSSRALMIGLERQHMKGIEVMDKKVEIKKQDFYEMMYLMEKILYIAERAGAREDSDNNAYSLAISFGKENVVQDLLSLRRKMNAYLDEQGEEELEKILEPIDNITIPYGLTLEALRKELAQYLPKKGGVTMKKKTPCERIKEAEKMCKEKITKSFDECLNEVKEHVDKCLSKLEGKPGYSKKPECIKTISYTIEVVDLNETINRKEGECFFIQFTRDGYVVVVGAGYDYGRPKSNLNARILDGVDKEWSNKAILIYVKNLRPIKNRCGAGPDKHTDNILQCRNGVEMYIGEYLLKAGIPILNKYSHRNYNYSEEEWEKMVNNILKDNNKQNLSGRRNKDEK